MFRCRTIWYATIIFVALCLRGEEAKDDVVLLPPFVTEGNTLTWCLARAPGVEVLSLLEPSDTREFTEAFLNARDSFNLIVPAKFQAPAREFITIILWDRKKCETVPPEVVKQYWPQNYASRQLPNLLIADLDNWTLFCTPALPPAYYTPEEPVSSVWRNMRLTPQLVRLLLSSRKPALPDWAIQGLSSVYEYTSRGNRSLRIRSAPWQWKVQRGDKGLPELAEILEEHGPSAPSQAQRLATAQHVFALWALQSGEQMRTEAFWRFVDQCSAGDTTEAMFLECFGYDYESADEQLFDFFKKNSRKEFVSTLPQPARNHGIQIESPSSNDIARIKGNWLRLAAGAVNSTDVELRAAYLSEGRKIVQHNLDKSSPDPALLRVAGLIEAADGKTEAARTLLEASFAKGSADATVGVALSRLRLDAINGSPDISQLTNVLTPLWQCCAVDSPPREAVIQAARALGAATVVPQEDVERLLHWTQFFPRDTPLLLSVGRILIAHDHLAEGRSLLQLSLRHADNLDIRQQIEALLSQTKS